MRLSTELSLEFVPLTSTKPRKAATEEGKRATAMGLSTELSLEFVRSTSTKQSQPAVSPRNVVPNNLDNQLAPEDRWKIKKVLTQSDVDGSSRLLVAKGLVQEHILPHVMGNPEEGEGVEVKVWDLDTVSEHTLFLKFQTTSKCYVLKKNWMSDFVRRRDLKKNDEIGLGWDNENVRLEFTVVLKNN